MKLCWDNIEGLRYNKKTDKWSDNSGHYYILKTCERCENEYLGRKESKFCCSSCIRKGAKHTKETIERIREVKTGTTLSEETKRKISEGNKFQRLEKHSQWKGRYRIDNIPFYDTYAPQIEWCEDVRRNEEDQNILENKCTYCGKWYISSLISIKQRIQALKGDLRGEHRLYCSDNCKQSCPIYGKSPDQLMREDVIRSGRLGWLELSREVQPELRKLVLERDKYECVKCGSDGPLHCHHIYPVSIEFIESADIDNCITLCIDCHKEAHKKDGCRLGQLRIEVC